MGLVQRPLGGWQSNAGDLARRFRSPPQARRSDVLPHGPCQTGHPLQGVDDSRFCPGLLAYNQCFLEVGIRPLVVALLPRLTLLSSCLRPPGLTPGLPPKVPLPASSHPPR